MNKKTVIATIGIITVTLIVAQDAKALGNYFDSWKYQVDTDEFEGTQKHYIWGKDKVEGFSVSIVASCTEGNFSTLQIYMDERLEDIKVMRVRFDEEPPKTFKAGKNSNEDSDWIYLLNRRDMESVMSKMEIAEVVKFEIFKLGRRQLVVSPDLEGFTEAWEQVKPHCYPSEQ